MLILTGLLSETELFTNVILYLPRFNGSTANQFEVAPDCISTYSNCRSTANSELIKRLNKLIKRLINYN